MAGDTHSKSTDSWLLSEDESLAGQQIEAVVTTDREPSQEGFAQ